MVVDVRVNDLYSNKEILEIFQQNVDCKILPRNLELNSQLTVIIKLIMLQKKKIKHKNLWITNSF